MQISKKTFGRSQSHRVDQYTISNKSGMRVEIITFGAALNAIWVPDRYGSSTNVVLSYPVMSGYQEDRFYVGGTIGRVAGRISNSRFTLKGQVFQLASNENGSTNHLHGGFQGFNKKNFSMVRTEIHDNNASVTLFYQSPDLEEGYPGTLDVYVNYTLTNDNELIMTYNSKTDKETHVNLTNHSYFNLSGKRTKISDHFLKINSGSYLETDQFYIPSGSLIPVDPGKCDFSQLSKINAVAVANGKSFFNECFALDQGKGSAAELYCAENGIIMNMATTMPGLVFYSGDFLDDPFIPCQGLCLETQYFPDEANRPSQATLLVPGMIYEHSTKLSFSTSS